VLPLVGTIYGPQRFTGAFALTMELDDTCGHVPASARRRTYSATVADRGWHFVPINVVGEGFGAEQLLGEVFTGQLSPLYPTEPQLRWNNGSSCCDVLERLDDGRLLAVCGKGPAIATRNGAVAGFCSGQHTSRLCANDGACQSGQSRA
jgi:hypothetical protein